MAKRRIILVSVVFFSLTVFTAQTLSQTRRPSPPKPPDTERLWNMTEEERKKEFAKRREQWKLYLERSRKMAAEEAEEWKRESAKRDEQLKLHWERLRNMNEEEWKREHAKLRRQRKLALERRGKESRKRSAERKRQREPIHEMRRFELEKSKKEWEKKNKEAGGFIYEKSALRAFGATEEQWKLIRAKLEKVRQLREPASSTVGMFLAVGSSDSGTSANVPAWQWKRPWKDKAPSELTEAQKLTKQLIALVERRNTTPQAFRRKMAALRKARSEETELKRQLSEARRELCEILTTRQEAALVLMNRL